MTVLLLLQFIGGDQDKDVAVLQLQCPEEKLHDLKRISLGNSSNLLVGQKVYAIGNPFGLDHTLTGQHKFPHSLPFHVTVWSNEALPPLKESALLRSLSKHSLC